MDVGSFEYLKYIASKGRSTRAAYLASVRSYYQNCSHERDA